MTFCVDEETKRLTQKMAENQGRTLSHDGLTEQANQAFEKSTQEKPSLLNIALLTLEWLKVKLKTA
ncbi:MAG: hypothetical protein ACRC6S_03205 [Shewanella sp.]